jgi:hypothetical protein
MIHIAKDEECGLYIKDGELIASVYMSDAVGGDDDKFLRELAQDYYENDSTEVGLDISFKLADMLDWTIECNELINEKDELILDIDSKPVFDKTKEELLKLIARIDSLQFK